MNFKQKITATLRIWLGADWLCQSCLRPAQIWGHGTGTWCKRCWEFLGWNQPFKKQHEIAELVSALGAEK